MAEQAETPPVRPATGTAEPAPVPTAPEAEPEKDWPTRYKYLLADFENFRRRTEREREGPGRPCGRRSFGPSFRCSRPPSGPRTRWRTCPPVTRSARALSSWPTAGTPSSTPIGSPGSPPRASGSSPIPTRRWPRPPPRRGTLPGPSPRWSSRGTAWAPCFSGRRRSWSFAPLPPRARPPPSPPRTTRPRARAEITFHGAEFGDPGVLQADGRGAPAGRPGVGEPHRGRGALVRYPPRDRPGDPRADGRERDR